MAVLRRRGEFWTVEFEGDSFVLRDRKGVRDLSRLLARPGEPIHVARLGTDFGMNPPPRREGESARAAANRIRKATANRLRGTITEITRLSPNLGSHLATSVRTGAFCVYFPDRTVRWIT